MLQTPDSQATNQNTTPKNAEQSTDILYIALTCLHVLRKNWYWFLLSIIVCMSTAYIFTLRQARVYSQSATILVDGNEAKSSRSNRAFNAIQDFSGIQTTDNLQDEIFKLTSRRLISRVVEQLHLDVSYSTTRILTPAPLFSDSPIQAEFLEANKGDISFDAEIDGNKIHVSITRYKGKKSGFEKTLTFNEPFKTPAGIVVFKKTTNTAKFNNKTIHITRTGINSATNYYRNCISAKENNKEANLVTITCHDTNFERAGKVLNTLLETYKADIVESKNSVANNTAKFIDERIELIGGQLSDVERELVDFKQSSNMLDFNLNVGNYLAQSTSSHQALIDLETRLAVVQSLRDFIYSHATSEGKLIPVLGALGNAGIEQQINEYNTLMVERNNLLANSSPTANPIVERDRILSAMRTTICSSIDNYISSIKIQISKAQNEDNRLRNAMTSAPQSEIKTLDITRQQKIKEALYTFLLNKREETALQLAINEANVSFVEYPYGYGSPISPHTNRTMLIALVIALIIPSGIFWLIIMLDNTVHNRKDIEDRLSSPILCDIPHWEGSADGSPFVSQKSNNDPVAEAFRILRYNLSMVMQKGVIVVTSSTPSQGKSFISRNTSAFLSMRNKTVLIDADLRKHTTSNIFNTRAGHNGLSSYLARQCEIDDILVKNYSDNLDFIPAGVRPPNPTELLTSSRLDKLIDTLPNDYG